MNRTLTAHFSLPIGVLLRRCLATVGACMALAAFSGSAFASDTCDGVTKIEDPIPGLIPPSRTHVTLETIMGTGLVSPVGGAVAPGLPNRIFVLDQIGKIWSIVVYGPNRGATRLV